MEAERNGTERSAVAVVIVQLLRPLTHYFRAPETKRNRTNQQNGEQTGYRLERAAKYRVHSARSLPPYLSHYR